MWWPTAQPAAAPRTPWLFATWPATAPTAAPFRQPALATPVAQAQQTRKERDISLIFMAWFLVGDWCAWAPMGQGWALRARSSVREMTYRRLSSISRFRTAGTWGTLCEPVLRQ